MGERIKVWVQAFKDRPALMLQWIDPDTGKRKSKSAKTADPKKAEEARGDLESDLNNNRYAGASRMPWERFRELFEAEYVAARRLNTRLNYDDTLNTFEDLCHPRRLDLITARTLSAFVTGMRTMGLPGGKKGMAPGTVKVRVQFLRTALRWAADQELIAKVPKFPEVRVPDKKPQPVPAESFEKLLLKAPDQQTRVYLLTGWLAGLRLSEVFALEWEPTDEAPYLDFGRERIILPAEFAKADADQWVPLAPELAEALASLPHTGPRVFNIVGRRGPISVYGMSNRVRGLAKKAGVKLTMHTLRKGFGCRYAGKVPAQVLQKLMRHSSITTTMAFYANVDEAVEEAVLGAKRNRLRNTRPVSDADAATPPDATTSPASPS